MADSEVSARIYFTDFFGVDPDILEAYGAFNVSLINDLPLFIDPFLLFDSEDETYQRLHQDIIRYVRFLRDRSVESILPPRMVKEWFHFPEVRQNWLGFSKSGNGGSGLGAKFAKALHNNLHSAFRTFGDETITRGHHLEKLRLLDNGVGRDHLSDFTTNLIKAFLLEYTQAFAQIHLKSTQRRRVAVRKVRFDYERQRWRHGTYELPYWDGDFVILTPKEILTKDEAWINRSDLLDRFHDIYTSLPDDQLRARIDEYFRAQLSDNPKEEEVKAAASATIQAFPGVLDYYIRQKEETGEKAHQISGIKVHETEEQFVKQVRELVDQHLAGTAFYQEADTFEASLRRVHFLKDVIENKDGYRLFYLKGKPLKREEDLQIMYRLTWYASTFEIDREVNNGRGPVDFKASKGSKDKTLIEFKLVSNNKLKKNLQNQVGVYEAANNTSKSIKVILFFSDAEYKKVFDTLKELNLLDRPDVVMIDAGCDNKPSASNA